ncbi:hypothetical protein ACFFWC_13225 [Plantactinospora siamensis]|uniref:DUF3995 domain-containing protein n=1 Tax=Plantactinospora siamensis TaxID=555372 RepID=A0ABV6P266_9ACTN
METVSRPDGGGAPARIRFLLWADVLLFAYGALSHAYDLAARGWPPYPAAGPGSNAFWAALGPIDALVAWLLVVRTRAGLLVGAAVLGVDVPLNAYEVLGRAGVAPANAGGFWRLVAVLGWFVVTAPAIWRRTAAAGPWRTPGGGPR